jgi:hypothetical protein
VGVRRVADEFDLLAAQRSVFRSDLRSAEKVVALDLLDHWSPRNHVFPSINRLAAWTSLDRTTVMRALDALKAREAIVVIQGEPGKANRYELGQLSLLAAHQSHYSTGRATRPVAPRGLKQSRHATGVVAPCDSKEPREGTQQRNPLESAPAQPSSPTEGAAKRPQRAKTPEVPLPLDWQPTEAHRAFATKHGLDLELEVVGFRGWAEGRSAMSWNGTFTTRLANQAKWNRPRASPGQGHATSHAHQQAEEQRRLRNSRFDDALAGRCGPDLRKRAQDAQSGTASDVRAVIEAVEAHARFKLTSVGRGRG